MPLPRDQPRRVRLCPRCDGLSLTGTDGRLRKPTDREARAMAQADPLMDALDTWAGASGPEAK
jgi:hypothetical protein